MMRHTVVFKLKHTAGYHAEHVMLLREKDKDKHHGSFKVCSQCNSNNADRRSSSGIAHHNEIINEERGYGRQGKERQGKERKTKDREVDT